MPSNHSCKLKHNQFIMSETIWTKCTLTIKSKPALDRDKNDGQELEKRDYRSFGISWINYENKIRDYFYKKCKKTFWTIKLYFGQLNYIFWTIKLYVHHPYRLGVGQTFQLSACNQTASYNPSNLIITRLKSKICWMKL